MGKVKGYKLKEVVYTLSPFEQKIMSTFWAQFGYKTKKRITENWVNTLTLVCPIAGTYMYAQNYVEKEKLHHRASGHGLVNDTICLSRLTGCRIPRKPTAVYSQGRARQTQPKSDFPFSVYVSLYDTVKFAETHAAEIGVFCLTLSFCRSVVLTSSISYQRPEFIRGYSSLGAEGIRVKATVLAFVAI
ncbi:hypothetical protein R1flu_019375 [Riccia fluitans]|uniref:Cytochrome b-c1 complex subunit 8 n=1 Tax=Riccia fluitans TaxID=41844 RepID=A0ABD1ZJI7_9MARC